MRDDHEIAIGLDVLLAMLAVNDEANGLDASNFAPLFKNVIKLSLIPESDTFQVEDLAFILQANLRINELEAEKVLEIAREVKRMRVRGESDEDISLFLRRSLERDRLSETKDLKQSLEREQITRSQKERSEKQRDIFIDELRAKRKGELRDQYDKELLRNRLLMLALPTIILLIVYFTINKLLPNQTLLYQFLGGAALEAVFGLLPLIPINKIIVKRYSHYVNGINAIVEDEISRMKSRADL